MTAAMRAHCIPASGENSPTLRYVLSPVVSDDIWKECHTIQGSDGIYVVYVAIVPAWIAGRLLRVNFILRKLFLFDRIWQTCACIVTLYSHTAHVVLTTCDAYHVPYHYRRHTNEHLPGTIGSTATHTRNRHSARMQAAVQWNMDRRSCSIMFPASLITTIGVLTMSRVQSVCVCFACVSIPVLYAVELYFRYVR